MTGSATAPHILLSYLWMSTTNDLFQRKTFKSDSASTGVADESDEDVANADPPSPQSIQDAGSTKRESLLDVWLAARALKPQHLAIGARTPVNRQSVALAYRIANLCAPEMLKLFWTDYPYRALFMISLGLVRGILPVTRGYSHAMIINEVQSLISAGQNGWSRLVRLLGTEVLRFSLEKLLESFASDNEQVVQENARFMVEYIQLEQRVRLDVPTLSDPVIRELLAESDSFVRSFQSIGGFGITSPFELIRVFTLLSEIVSHIVVLCSLPYGPLPLLALLFSLVSAAVPFFRHSYGYRFDARRSSADEIRQAERQEQMRQLALDESYRPEVMLFGLGPWIMSNWSSARRAAMGRNHDAAPSLKTVLDAVISQFYTAEIVTALQNVPFVLMLKSSTTLGSLALYRTSAQAIVLAISNLVVTTQMVLQSIYLMGAFCASTEIRPHLQPTDSKRVNYEPRHKGMKIEARNLWYTYPGATDAALKGVSFTIEAGETLAIVGYNGSGKSTLAKILLRLVEFESGELLINDVDIRCYDPADLHTASTAVLQTFARYDSTVRENVGTGLVAAMDEPRARTLRAALSRAKCEQLVRALPHGIDTRLDASAGASSSSAPATPLGTAPSSSLPHWSSLHGLSGGEWQRIALARAFMRADRPEVDFLLFDEPTSALDAQAQAGIFDTIEGFSRGPDGERCKTVVFITHRLSTARRADKVAMMENGRIIEFGSHEELLARGGAYAALYNASV